MSTDVYNISSMYIGADGISLCGFPALKLVEELVDSIQQFYQEKTKRIPQQPNNSFSLVTASVSAFRLFPKQLTLKQPSRITGSLLENIPRVAEQFQYEQDSDAFSNGSRRKTARSVPFMAFIQLQTQSNPTSDLLEVKRTPVYRLYQHSNPVLKDEYTILVPAAYRRMNRPEQQKRIPIHQISVRSQQPSVVCQERIQDWIDLGYHINICQAFKAENNPSSGRVGIYVEKLQGKTLRDWINGGFFNDKNKVLNSKRIINILLQISVGLNYLHSKKNFVHQDLTPENIFVQNNDRCIKIGNMYSFNAVASKIVMRNPFGGGSPEYWSFEQGNIYNIIKERGKQDMQSYLNCVKLIPDLTPESDLYQLGLIILQLLTSNRFWGRGDIIDPNKLQSLRPNSCLQEVSSHLIDQAQQFLRHKPEERPDLITFITGLLDLYESLFKSAQDLLWMRYFDEAKYESDLLNNKAVGLYLAGNELECQKTWLRSLAGNPRNLVAQYNSSHYKRMKRMIDDIRLNKDLLLLPESRKRNFYIVISNLVTLPLLKEPFKTYNFNPKLSRGKEIEVMTNVIEQLAKNKKTKDYVYQKRYFLGWYKFEGAFLINSNRNFIGRLKGTNTLYLWSLDGTNEPKPYNYMEFKAPKEPLQLESRTSLITMDPSLTYLALTENSYLCVFKIDVLTQPAIHMEIKDYGSTIMSIQFDLRSEVIAIGSNEFTIKLMNLVTKDLHKVINVGQKFVINNLRFYDRNSCIGFSCEKSIIFHRIETSKPLFTLRLGAIISTYRTIEVTVNNHILIALTMERFQIWNLKDKLLLRNIDIDEAPHIQNFYTLGTNKKIVIHYGKNVARLWNYNNGLILKSYRVPVNYTWASLSEDFKHLQTLTSNGVLTIRNIDFDDFLKNFQGVCVPSELSIADDREDSSEDMTNYIKYGKLLVKHLNEYRVNEHDKKVSLDAMSALAETVKGEVFFQDKPDIKAIFTYLNSIKSLEQKSSRFNSHSEEYIFTSRKDDLVSCVSNMLGNTFAIGDSTGTVRIVEPPNTVLASFKPFSNPISHIYLEPSTMFVSSQTSCALIERESMSIIVSHSGYHKLPILFGCVLNNIFVTGDEQQTILYWNKDKVRKYAIPVLMGDVVGTKLLLVGKDNRIRLYEVSDEGMKKVFVFVGHTMPVYRITVVDDGIFISYSYDGTLRWWNVPAKLCFTYYHYKKYVADDRILYIDLPKQILQETREPKFDKEGAALILANNSEVLVFDTLRKQIKYRFEIPEDVTKVFWTDYPNTFAVVTNAEVRIYNLYLRYAMKKIQ